MLSGRASSYWINHIKNLCRLDWLPKVRAQKCDNKVECAAGSGLLPQHVGAAVQNPRRYEYTHGLLANILAPRGALPNSPKTQFLPLLALHGF
jgi:hypothetical protein